MVHGQPFDKGGPIPFFPVPTSSRRQDFFTSFQQSPNTLQVSAPMLSVSLVSQRLAPVDVDSSSRQRPPTLSHFGPKHLLGRPPVASFHFPIQENDAL
jgi:hypothetical protein